jgi:hypothetical protein
LKASKTIGGLLVVSAVLGIVLLAVDKVLRSGAPSHYDALIGFVIVDLVVGALAIAKPTAGVGRLTAVWAALRILIQIADLSQAPVYQFSYAQFADYLFNPLSSLSTSFGNPAGIPSVPIDLILIIDIVVLVMALRTRKQTSQ